MPKPDTDNEDKNVDDDPKEVNGVAPTLDQVHAFNQRKVEDEDLEDDDTNTDEDAEEEDDENADEDSTDDTSGDNDDEDSGDDAGDDATASDIQKPVVQPSQEDTDQSTTELDTDTTKPGKGKVAIVDGEGVKHYFNNLDEVPDDFEPASYKALMVGTRELLKKEETDAAAEVARLDDVAKAELKATTDAMQVSWENDSARLVKDGLFPSDPKKLATAKEEVYQYMEDEMKKGNVITSFNQAYKSLQFDKQQAKAKEDQKEVDAAKKKRGGMVQGGSGSTPPNNGSTRGKVLEAPPSGAGLDRVHAHVMSSL